MSARLGRNVCIELDFTIIHNVRIVALDILSATIMPVCLFCLILSLGCAGFAEILQNCGAPYFWYNVLDSFSCFYIEIAYSNFTFYGAYTFSFLVCHSISVTS